MRRASEALEAGVLDWATCRRGPADTNDLFSLIVNSPQEDGARADPALIAGLAPTALLTVYHTCQTALIWTLVLLAQHPRAAARLAEEVQNALAGDAPSLARVGRLTWLDHVVKESLRILPPVPLQSRVAHDDTTLAGWPMRARSRVLLSAFHTNRAPALYPDPERFRPERWDALEPSQCEFAAFSSGPRNCPGQAFGVSLVKLALAAIVSRWRIEIRPGARVDYRVRITMAPRAPIPARLRPQDRTYERTRLSGAYVKLISQTD
jgi:cytochrome P450